MTLNKLFVTSLAFNACFASAASAAVLSPLTINIDENTKNNTTIGQVRFVDGSPDKTVTIEVGVTPLSNWVTNGEAFENIAFNTPFSAPPLLFGQLQTGSDYNIAYTVSTYSHQGGISAPGNEYIMRHRTQNVSALGFDVILESELDKRGTSVVSSIDDTGNGELLGWLAVSEPVQGIHFDKHVEIVSSGLTVTHNEYGQALNAPFSESPTVVTHLSTYNGVSQSGVAVTELKANKAKFFIDNIDDTSHNAENVNVLATEDGTFFATESHVVFGETGTIEVDDTSHDAPFTIPLKKQFNNPVIFVQAEGIDKTIYDAALRITDVSNKAFSAYLHSSKESVLPTSFGKFNLHYQVFEAGEWEMPLEHYRYDIVSGNEANTFSIDPISGKIKIADQTQLDFESGNNEFAFTVQVTDGMGNTVEQSVTVTVNDINDSLNNTAQILEGLAADDWTGWAVAPAGDVNGDGFDDIIVGVPQDDAMGEDAGLAYVFFSDASGQLPTLSEVQSGTRGFGILGANAGDNAGFAVSGNIDVNGDGLSDVVVGAPYSDVNGNGSGSVYVVFGKTDNNPVLLKNFEINAGSKGFAMHGAYTKDYAGGTLAVGDVNGDGLGDIIIGETTTRFLAGTGSFELRDLLEDGNADPHMAYVVFGKANGIALNLGQVAEDDNTSGFSVSRTNRKLFNEWHYGAQVLPTGDVNSDGLTDFIVSNGLYVDTNGTSYIVYGRVETDSVNYNSIARDDNGALIRPEGANYGFDFGNATLNTLPAFATSNVGDVNADGVDDMALLLTDTGCCDAIQHPRAYIVFGNVNLNNEINLSDIANGVGGFVIHNDASNIDHHDLAVILGSIGGAGDLNGDGYDDIIIGDPFAENNKGRVYAVYGKSGNEPVYLSDIIDTAQGFYSEGNGGEQLGQFIASAGDINGDGIKDIQFGTPSANTNNLNNNGAVYVLKGNGSAITSWGSVGNDSFSGSTSAQRYAPGMGDDFVATNGGADVVYAGPGDDLIEISDTQFIRIDGGGGVDTLKFNGSGISLNLAAASAKARSIEVFDIRGSGANVLSLNKSVSGNASLRILGDADDAVKAANNQWIDTGTVVVIDNIEYAVFSVGAAKMLVQTGVSVAINNAPTINEQTFTVSEYTTGGSSIGVVEADANDIGDSVSYSIVTGNESNAFTVDSATGSLSVHSSVSRLDYETQASYALEVQVTDTYGAIDRSIITVNVNDVEYISHTLTADLSATESTFGSTAFTDILHVATMNEIGTQLGIGEGAPVSKPADKDDPVEESWNDAWNKTVDKQHSSTGGVVSMDLKGEFFFEPRFAMQTGQVVSDIPVTMELAYADEVQAGRETLITSKFVLDNFASFSATSPAFDLSFSVGVKDVFYQVQSSLILDNNNQPLNKQTSLDEGTNTISITSDEIAVIGRHCGQTVGQPACHIGAYSEEENQLRISASIDAKDWVEQELWKGTTWKTWFYAASGQAISQHVKECREDFFYPAGEDLYYDYKFDMLDTLISIHADLKQDFYLEVRPVSKLTLEDGSVLIFRGDDDIAFTPEHHHDVNGDGVIDANLAVDVYSVFYNDTKTSVGARLPFKMGIAEWNVQEAVCTADQIYLYQQSGAMYEKGKFGPVFDFEFGFLVEEMSLTEWKWDEAAAALASPFVKKSESTEPLPPYLYNDNEWLLAHEKINKRISFDLCNQDGHCGAPIKSFHNNAPQADNIVVSGNFIAKDTISARYSYSDFDGDAESNSVYQWFVATQSDGSDALPIEGADTLSYPLAIQDINKYVQFCVKPNDGEKYGSVACSDWAWVESPFFKDFSIATGFGNALELNGVDESLRQHTAYMFNPGTTSFTIETWLNVHNYNVDKPINILTFNSGSSSKAALRVMTDGRLRSKTTDTTYFSTDIVEANKWHHIAISYDQDTSTLVIYLDGEPVISQVDTITPRDVDLVWGANGTQTDRFVEGEFDEIRFWSVARTQQEIQAARYLSVSASHPDLLSYLTFDNDDASYIADLTNNTNVEIQNGVVFTPHTTTLVLDGDGDYFNVPYSDSDLNWGGESFTVQARIYLDSGSGGTTRLIMNKKLSGASGHNGWSFRVNASNELEIHLKPVDGSQTMVSTSTLKTDRWYFVAFTVDRSAKKLTLYINGNRSSQQNLGNKTNINSAYPLRLGAYSGTGTSSANFKGQMDNVALWNRVLTEDELNACKHEMVLGCEESLFLYYDFEDSSGKNKAISRFNGSANGDAYYHSNDLSNSFSAVPNQTFNGALPLGENAAVEVIELPKLGDFYINEYTGEFEYTPFDGTSGSVDSLSYILYSNSDGYSVVRKVDIRID
jgi:hypothetical protein